MIVLLQPVQISAYWEALKHSVTIAYHLSEQLRQPVYNEVLARLLSGKAQAWLGFEDRDGERHIYGCGLTTIETTGLGETYLYLHTLYAFRPIPSSVLEEMIPRLEEFARNAGCTKMVTFTLNGRLQDFYTQCGFKQDPAVYIKDL